MKTALIYHLGDAIGGEGLVPWLSSFSDLVGVIAIAEPKGRLWKRIRREWQRSGPLRFFDVLAFRAYYKTRLARPQLLDEWRRSREVLSEILGEPVTCASVPGGYDSRAVAETAAEAGLTHLFNSEPTTRTAEVEGCHVHGRYTIYRGMTASMAASLAAGSPPALLGQAAAWKLKKALKAVGGRAYVNVRQALLDRKYGFRRR